MNGWQRCWLMLGWLWGCTSQAVIPETQTSITLTLQQVPLQLALQTLAEYQQLNLVLSADVRGVVTTLRLLEVPWQQALEILLQGHGLQKVIRGNLLLVTQKPTSSPTMPPAPGDPIVSVYFTIHHAKAADLATLLQGARQEGLLSPRGTVYVDPRTNQLLVRDVGTRLAAIKQFITRFDQAASQVQIEARIVTMSHEDLRKLGVHWRLAGSPEELLSSTKIPLSIQLPISDAGNQGRLQVAKMNGRILDLELSALAQENRVEIIAMPKLLTIDRHTASIKQGSEIPYAVAKSKGNTAIEFREAVLELEVTPTTTSSGTIVLALKISQNTPGKSVKVAQGEAISIDKQEIRTQVRLADGETVVLGGVFQRFGQQIQERVPLLGQLPLVGVLFQRQTQQFTKRELVIFVTPRLLSTPPACL
jgi:type IV pilus secretin PilQ/predicted competence protein